MGRFFQPQMVVHAVVLLLLSAGKINVAEASVVEHAAALGPYVNDDTFVAAHFDVAAWAKTKGDASAIFRVLPSSKQDTAAVRSTLQGLDRMARDLNVAGVDSVYAVAGLADVNQRGGPVFVLQVRQGKAATDVATLWKSMMAKLAPSDWQIEARLGDEKSVLVGRPWTLDRYAKFAKSDRTDLTGPLSKLSNEGSLFAAVICPGPDFRRVVRELWPDLPGSLAPLRGELADKWRHLEIAIGAAPDARPRVALQANDKESAEVFAKLWSSLPDALDITGQYEDWRREGKELLRPIVDDIQPRMDGTRATLDFNVKEPQMTALRNSAGEAIHAITESNRRHRRFNQFKEMTIAMINYHESKKHLPASAAIRDKDGNPLLSWRVAILPYLNEEKLYKQFRLDEPWDSPHNRALIDKMPAVYADPDSKLNELSRAGKTTYQVPVAAETIFHSQEGTQIRDITDGTSKTILIMEVDPSRAVEWTKPQDYEVDVQNPLKGVARVDRTVFTAGFADAHVEAIRVDAEPAKLRGLLTRDGKEVFDWP